MRQLVHGLSGRTAAFRRIVGCAVLTGLAACSQVAAVDTLPAEATVRVGEAVHADEGRVSLAFVRVVDDSRCPPDPKVQCVWEGEAVLALRVTAEGSTRDATVGTLPDRRIAVAGAYRVELLEVSFPPASTPGAYEARFRLTAR